MTEPIAKEEIPGASHSLPDSTFIMIEGSIIVGSIQADCVECADMERIKNWPNAQLGALYGPPYLREPYGMCMHTKRFNDLALRDITACPTCMGKGTLDH